MRACKSECLLFYINFLVLPTANVDGGMGFILPVPERMYRRLNMLQTKMTQGFSHPAGLNPKASRLKRTRTTGSYGFS